MAATLRDLVFCKKSSSSSESGELLGFGAATAEAGATAAHATALLARAVCASLGLSLDFFFFMSEFELTAGF